MRTPVAGACVAASFVGAVGVALGTVVAGRLAERPSPGLVVLLAGCVVGAALLDVVGLVLWAGVVDRAEGRLRGDLLAAALRQPLAVLGEQAVGEVLDRVDDDTHEVGATLRRTAWSAVRSALTLVPLWLVGGFTWWPAFVLVPLAAVASVAVVRGRLSTLVRLKVEEERAWTDHAAVVEEGVAARDDLRTSGGQAHVLRRSVELAARVHARFAEVITVESAVSRRTGLLLHASLTGVALAGVALVLDGGLSTAALVTLFLVMTQLVGQVDMTVRHLPDLQSGLGAVLRLRQLLAVEAEAVGGLPLPAGELDVELRHLHFAYEGSDFALVDVDLTVAAGTTCALVGRTGSGKSTLVLPALAGGGAGAGQRAARRHRRARPGPVRAAQRGRRGDPAHRGARRHARGEHHAVRRPPPPSGGGRGGRARPERLGGRAAARPGHRPRPGWHHAVGRRGAAGRLRPAARARRAGRRARRGHGADGPGHRGPRGACLRTAAGRTHRPAGRAPALDHRPGRPGRRARPGSGGAAGPPGPPEPLAGPVRGPARGGGGSRRPPRGHRPGRDDRRDRPGR